MATFFAVSVGPGDPELLTLKAVRTLERCPVIAAPLTKAGHSLALGIARQAADLSGKELLPLRFGMTSDEAALAAATRQHADAILAHLQQGRDVAMVTLGDVSVYSTAAPIGAHVRESGHDAVFIPGVTSFCASACALGISLTTMKQPLHLCPASFAELKSTLAQSGTKVLMKSAGSFARVREAVLASAQRAYAVVDCGLPTQAVYEDLRAMPDDPGYFTTIIVKDD